MAAETQDQGQGGQGGKPGTGTQGSQATQGTQGAGGQEEETGSGGLEQLAWMKDFVDEKGQVKLKVDGKERLVGPAELREMLQKGVAADSRFREATKAREEAALAVKFMEDARAAAAGDQEAMIRVGMAIGMTEEQITERLSQRGDEGEDEGEGDETGEEGDGKKSPVRRKVKESPPRPDPRLDYIYQKMQEMEQEEHRRRIWGDLEAGVDSDPRFAKLRTDKDHRATLVDLGKDVLRRLVVVEQRRYGPETVGAVLDELHGKLKKLDRLGILSTEGESRGRLPGSPGVGPSTGLASNLTVHREAGKLKRVPVTDPSHEEFLMQELARMAEDVDREALQGE